MAAASALPRLRNSVFRPFAEAISVGVVWRWSDPLLDCQVALTGVPRPGRAIAVRHRTAPLLRALGVAAFERAGAGLCGDRASNTTASGVAVKTDE